jgi:hypothetical protein
VERFVEEQTSSSQRKEVKSKKPTKAKASPQSPQRGNGRVKKGALKKSAAKPKLAKKK